MTREELLAHLTSGKMNDLRSAMEPHLHPSIGFDLHDGDEDDFTIGSSRIGGRPDVYPGFVWPVCKADSEGRDNDDDEDAYNDDEDDDEDYDDEEDEEDEEEGDEEDLQDSAMVPLSFIAQVNLQEVSALDDAGLLPQRGMLYFFYTPYHDAWGDDGDEADKFAVRYYDGDLSALSRAEFPEELPDEGRYEPVGITPVLQTSWPSLESSVFQSVKEKEIDNFMDSEIDTLNNKMLGYADPVQGEMELLCETVTSGADFPTKSTYKKRQQEAAEKWQLLLQVESSEERGFMLEDGGVLYFWIKKQDLAARRFENCWFQVQSG